MIAVVSANGNLRIVAEIAIPNGHSWGAERTSRLIAHIEQFVFAAELADKDLPKSHGRTYSLPALSQEVNHDAR